MPVEITAPQEGGNFGPGVNLEFRETGGGPFPETDQWQLELLSGPTHEVHERYGTLPFTPFPVAMQWLDVLSTLSTVWEQGESGRLTTGQGGRLIVRHLDQNGLVLGQDSVDIIWQETVGTGEQVYEVSTQLGGGTGGFTEDDRAVAEQTLSNSQLAFPLTLPDVGAIVRSAGEMLGNLAPSLLFASDCQILTGRGSLTRPGGPFPVNAYGVQWFLEVVPPELGRRDGVLVEYDERILQLVVVQRDITSVEFPGAVIDVNTDGGRYVWGLTLPSRILYDVTPGCEVRLCWLLLTLTP